MSAALIRFRVIAYIVGVFLLILAVGMPLKYLADQPVVVEVIGPIHGFLYMVYLVLAFNLAVRAKWSLPRTVLILAAGTVPVMSFFAERRVTRWITAQGPTEEVMGGGPRAESAVVGHAPSGE